MNDKNLQVNKNVSKQHIYEMTTKEQRRKQFQVQAQERRPCLRESSLSGSTEQGRKQICHLGKKKQEPGLKIKTTSNKIYKKK